MAGERDFKAFLLSEPDLGELDIWCAAAEARVIEL